MSCWTSPLNLVVWVLWEKGMREIDNTFSHVAIIQLMYKPYIVVLDTLVMYEIMCLITSYHLLLLAPACSIRAP